MKSAAQIFLALLLIATHRVEAELVAHWPLDGNAEDLLGNHNGSDSGVTFGAEGAANHTGTAAEFNGSNSTITVPFDSATNPESFTLSMWVNADSTNGFASPVTSRDDTPGSVHGYLVYNDSGGNWNFWTGTGGPSGAWNQMSGGPVEVGSWTHLAVSYDDTSETKRLYVNGALAASNSATNLYSPNGPQSENLHIGSGADTGGSFYFDGLIDDVALWDHALTPSEIEDVMIHGVPGGPPSINTFEASPPFVDSGQSVTLSWNVQNATSVNISPDVGTVAAESGNIVVTPDETTTYTITASGESGPVATSQVTVGVDVESLAPIINEFVADNENGILAPDGSRSDWVELHNPNPFAIEIGGWHLSDDSADLEKFTFPPGQIPAGGYLVFFADESPGSLNFQLAKSGDHLALSDPNGNVVSRFSPTYPPQFDDVSYGVSSSGTITYLMPTPGAANGPPRSEIGPEVEGLTKNPSAPAPTENLLITATITPRIGDIASASLFYRVGFGSEKSLTMTADANDQFSANIPASAFQAGEMVRWYLIATTTTGESTREPPFPDPTESPQYLGTVVSDPSISVDQPVMHWFVQNSGAADTRGGTRGSLYFEGQFYDNIFCRIRGQSTANWPKHKYKFDFYRGGHFRWRPDAGRVEEINVNSHYRDSYVRENSIFAFLNEAGAMAPETRYLWIKRNGSDMGLFTFVEQVDEDFLDRRGVDPTGSMYKAINVPATLSPTVNSSLYRKVLRKNEPFTDLRELTSGINISNPGRFDFVADAVNLPNYINVMAAMCVPFNHDQLTKNYYVYHDLDRGEWFRIAWDGDQGLPTGRTNGNENWSSPLYGDALHTQELVGGNPNPIWQNHLHAAILDNPVTREMYMRRVRTLMDEYLAIPEAGPSTTILAEGANIRYWVPFDSSLESSWYLSSFDDTAWASGTAGLGYENNPGDYIDLIETRVKPSEVVAGGTSIYQRFHFNITDPSPSNLVLRMRYDDGFVAYLNGVEIARDNISGTVRYNSTASSHPDTNAVNFVDFPLPGASLTTGDNVLAIQIINQSPGSSDLLCEPELVDRPGANGGYFENILEGFRSTIQNDVVVDQALWSGAGITNFNSGYNGVLNTSLPNRRTALFETYGPNGSGLIPLPQSTGLVINFGTIESNPGSGNQDEEFIELTNPNNEAVDLSGWTMSGGVEFSLPPGTVIPSNGNLYLSPNVRDFRLRTASPTGGEGRYVVGNYDGHLSNFAEALSLSDSDGALVAETVTEDQPSDVQRFLVISEIMYHPAGEAGEEFIELMNISDHVTLNLGGISFTDGINHTIPNGTFLAPGSRMVIGASNFENGTALSNGGETLKLEDSASGTISEFRYDDQAPWPVSPDGNGTSLILLNPKLKPDPSLASNWRPSLAAGGNPGTSDALAFNGQPNGDLNGNGTPDLIDYALGDKGSITMNGNTFSYRRRLGADDVTLQIEASTDLANWSNASDLLMEQSRTDLGDGMELVVSTLAPAVNRFRRFFRIRTTLNLPQN
ncbi:lamin tail domain-containing protein [bacterium]|nr:lamin tail domain-containing protein [bacterium]